MTSTITKLPQAETQFASERAAAIFADYFQAKSSGDADQFVARYALQAGSHSDAVLGLHSPDWDSTSAMFHAVMPNWNGGISYATRILGDDTSAVVFVTDSPELFGSELRTISAVDLTDGKIARFVDYWDGRQMAPEALAGWRVPADQFPSTFGEETAPSTSHDRIGAAVDRLVAALTSANASAVGALLSPDAVFEDLTLQIALHGSSTIVAGLERATAVLPYGKDVVVRRVLGAGSGGGFEWVNSTNPVARGISALTLDGQGRIAEITSTWDATIIPTETVAEWTRLLQRGEPGATWETSTPNG
jgi:hypothetical protein